MPHYFYLLAGGGGDTAPVDTSTATLSSPTLVNASSAQKQSANISWEKSNLSNATYEVHVANTANFAISTQTFIAEVVDADSLVFDGLTENTNYFVKLLATHANGDEKISNELSFKTARRDYQTTTATIKVVDATINSNTITTSAEVGDIVVSENGYLRKVISTSATSVETEPAKLRDVFTELSFSSSSVLSSSETSSTTTSASSATNIVRTFGVSSNSNIAAKVERKWQQTKFSITDNLANKTISHLANNLAVPIPNKQSLSTMAHGVQLQDENNFVIDGKLKITGAKSVILNPGDELNLELIAELLTDDKDETVYLQSFSVEKFKNSYVSTHEDNYGMTSGLDVFTKNDRIYKQKRYINWTPKDYHVSDEPYILTVKVEEDEDSDDWWYPWFYRDTLEYKVYIYVTNNNTDFATDESKSFNKTSADGNITMQSSLDIGFEPRFDVEGDYGITGLDYAKVVVGGTLSLKQDIIIDALGESSLNGQTDNLIDKTFVKVVIAGGVPVVITGQFTLYAEYEASADAKLNITHDFDSSFAIEAGVEYDDERADGERWQTFKKSAPTYEYKLKGEADARVFGEVRLVPQLTVKIYEAAYGTMLIEPYLNAETEVEGNFKYTQSYSPTTNFNEDWDADYRFTQLALNGGVDIKLRLGLDIFEDDGEDLIGYPSDDKTDFKVFKPIDNKPLYGLPTMSSIATSPVSYKDSRAIKLNITIEDIAHPFDSSEKSLNPFAVNTLVWLSREDSISFVYPNAADHKEVYMLYNQPIDNFTIKAAGYSELGKFFRQYQTLDITELADNNSNNIPDYWESTYSDSDDDGLSYLDEFNNGTLPHKNDSDDDGMDDKYEVDYGLDPLENDASGDNDGDGFSNIEEFNAGTNPSDANSYPQNIATPTITTVIPQDSSVYLAWSSVTSATYSIYYAKESFVTFASISNYATLNSGTLISNITTNNKIITNLDNGTTYYFVVTATKDNAESSISNEVSAIPQTPTSTLNDTGITWGADYPSGNNATCTGESVSAQDCSHGRDVTHNDDSDGHAGFSFTKLSATGAELSSVASNWSCVKDNITGLIWEVKTTSGLHNKDDSYNWYNTDSTTNGGADGYADDDGDICYGYDAADSTTYCNTQAFAARVNAASLCGASDWRLPSREELRSIVNYSRVGPSIDTHYFPNTPANDFWSSSPNAANAIHAWRLDFGDGDDSYGNRYNDYRVRLVRSGQ